MHPLAEALDGYVELDSDLRCVYGNAAVATLFGVEPAGLEGRSLAQIAGGRVAAALDATLRAVLTDGEARRLQIEDGVGRQLRCSLNAVRGCEGALLRVGVQLAELALEAPARRLPPMTANIFGMLIWRADGAIVDANDAYLELVGCTSEELRAGLVDWRALTPPEHLPRTEQALAEIAANGMCTPYEKEYLRRDGRRVWVLIGGSRLDRAGHEGIAYAIDITERKHAEQELRRSQEELAEAQRMAHVGSWRLDLATRLQVYSDEMRRIFGLPLGPDILTSDEALARIHPDDRESMRVAGLAAMRVGGKMEISFRGLGPGDDVRYMRSIGEAIVEDGRVTGMRGTTQDVTAERHAAEALRESEARFRALIENLGVGVMVHGRGTELRMANRAAVELLGVSMEQLLGTSSYDAAWNAIGEDGAAVNGADRPVARAIATRRPVRDVIVGVQYNAIGERTWLLVNAIPELDEHGEVKQVISTFHDVTERRRMQERLALADRLASVGTLAAGVAHEINNPLSYVMANLAYIADEIGQRPGLEALAEVVAEAQEGAARVRDIVRDLRTFSRGDDTRRGATDVRRVIESSVSIVWNQIRHSARLVIDLGDLPLVPASEPRLGQVFVNLLANAAQSIRPGAVDTNEIRITGHTDGLRRVVVEVSDTGCGIAAEDLKRIFDPFFTTKPIGVGTGLGLSVCQGIVAELDGEITVESAIGKGTTFRVALPALEAEEIVPAPAVRSVGPVGMRARVLVVDDEPAIGASIARVLGDRHEIVALTSGLEALERVGRDPGAFDVLLCDLMMPDLDGIRLHQRIVEIAPELARSTVFFTGGAFTAAAQEFLAKTSHAVLEKPFDIEQLVGIIDAAARKRSSS